MRYYGKISLFRRFYLNLLNLKLRIRYISNFIQMGDISMNIGITLLIIGLGTFLFCISSLIEELKDSEDENKKIIIIWELLEAVFFSSLSRLFWIVVSFSLVVIGIIMIIRHIV